MSDSNIKNMEDNRIKELKVARWFLIASWILLVLLITTSLMARYYPGSEQHPLYVPLMMMGMFIIPLSVLVSGIFFVIGICYGFIVFTPKSLTFSALGLSLVISYVLRGIGAVFMYLNIFITLMIVAISTLSVVKNKRHRIDKSDPIEKVKRKKA